MAGTSGMPGNFQQQDSAAAQQKANEQELMKQSILSQVLDQDALARLSNLAAVKPDKARGVEAMIIQMARTGQIGGKLDDEGFKKILNQVSAASQKVTTVKFDRRRCALDSDDDDY
ncbi:unnamed protein product [Bursaphelenchus okinawaensis]|uniref:Programmed cell death protein 5 n=1 Tax=Bursaphelenchus okinawaensis TaxID=465554 RepID=A0A811JUU4_9BILA|nr:unnamed protein product [Bursaphelenchus okinawaensis]CAG9084254.1 unnamed protein product [Bursaphelenchus okinawaensis]